MKKIIFLFSIILLIIFSGCKDESPTISNTDCLTQLDKSQKCKAILPDCDGEKLKNSLKCLGTNASGKRCGNNTLNPCGYCYLHEDQWDGTCPNDTKNACGYCDDHTNQYNK